MIASMLHVTIRQLEIFDAAARALSFARVAERLHLTPAAVSFQIKQLETTCGFELFERLGKRLALTEAGQALQSHAKLVLQTLQDADQTLMALKGMSGGRVTVGLVSTAKHFVPHLVARFQSAYPAVVVHLEEGNRRQVIDALVKGEIDLAVMGQPPAGVDVDAEVFAPHPSIVVAPPGHPLAGSRCKPEALAREPFIVREGGSGTHALMEQFFEGAQLSPRIVMSSSSNETIKQAVMAGMGLALISRHTVGLELALGLMTELDVKGLPLMRSWFIAHRRTMPLLPIHARLREFVRAEGAAILDGLERTYEQMGARCRNATREVQTKRGSRRKVRA